VFKMTFEEYKYLPEQEQKDFAITSYREDDIYAGVRREFLEEYGDHPKIAQVLVDNYGMGDAPVLILTLRRGKQKLRLPEYFMGFLIYRRYLASGHKLYKHPQEETQQPPGTDIGVR
jgi:hypothetical protein